jgi:hypothetical protein
MSLPPPPPATEVYVFKPRAGGMYTLENLPVGTRFAYGSREGVLLACNFSEAKVRLGSDKPLYWSPATPVRVLGDNEKIQNSSPEVGNNDIQYSQPKQSPETETGVSAMKIQKSVAVKLLNALGVKSVTAKQKCEQMQEKLVKLLPKVEDPEIVKDAELRETLEEIMQSAAAGKPIEVVEDSGETEQTEEQTEEPSEKPKPKAKAQKSAARETTEDKPKAVEKKTTTNKADSGEPKITVTSTIKEALLSASKTKPVTKAEIVAKLVKQFPEREEKSMASTVTTMTQDWTKEQYYAKSGVKVTKTDSGMWGTKVKK